ncbi:MAG: hypothetical protein Q7R30_11410 [Acidobacteriota bacterium]|nr:hypothetical protein [Acidobacteriota bacterium]
MLPAASGMVAKSAKFTAITPSVLLIGVGNGSVVLCANTGDATSMATTKMRIMQFILSDAPR